MKFTVTFKTPDATHYAMENIPEDQQDEAEALLKKFVKYDEYVNIEFDTEAGTATVKPQ